MSAEQKIWKPSPKQEAIVKALSEANRPLTLDEISEAVGEKLTSGTISVLVKKGLIKNQGKLAEKTVTIVKKVSVYTMPDYVMPETPTDTDEADEK